MQEVNGLKIIQRVENFMMDLIPALRKFPKTEKYTLAQDIEKEILEATRAIHIAAFDSESRSKSLRKARISFQICGFLLRIARRQAFLSDVYFEKLSVQLVELGKMTSGWIKTSDFRSTASLKKKEGDAGRVTP